MPDNLASIGENFECRVDPRYADGYAYLCQHCGIECNVGEISFDCQDGRIVPLYIICRFGCGKSWRLQILPAIENIRIQ